MAINNVGAPSVLGNLVADPFLFEFNMTPVETATERRRFGYQLLDENDNPISAKELITPIDGQNFLIDFNDDIYPLVSTAPPECDDDITAQPEMEATVKLMVFEHVFNKDTCAITIENETTLGDYTILNSANQYWGPQVLSGSGWAWLNPMTEIVQMCRSRCQLIYVWSNANVSVQIQGRSISGNTYIINRTNTPGAHSFLVDPRQIADQMTGSEEPTIEGNLPRIKWIKVLIDSTEVVQFELVDCCSIKRIAWQHSGGGYSFMKFDDGEERSVRTSGAEVYRYQDKAFSFAPYLKRTRTVGGTSIASRVSYKFMSFKSYFDARSDRDRRYLEDFLSSGSYYYEYEPFTGSFDPGGLPQYELVKFIPSYGRLTYYREEELFELTFAGKIAQPHQMPNYAT